MKHYICTTCGVQFAASEQPPAYYPICEDERQDANYIPLSDRPVR